MDPVEVLAQAMHRARIGCEYDADLGSVASPYWCDDLPPNFHQGSKDSAWRRHREAARRLMDELEKGPNT